MIKEFSITMNIWSDINCYIDYNQQKLSMSMKLFETNVFYTKVFTANERTTMEKLLYPIFFKSKKMSSFYCKFSEESLNKQKKKELLKVKIEIDRMLNMTLRNFIMLNFGVYK